MIKYKLWAGTYTQGEDRDGIYLLGFDGKALSVLRSWGGLTDPSYLQPAGDRIFAVEELPSGGAVVELTENCGNYRRFPVRGDGYCHIAVCGERLYASGYTGGCLVGLDLRKLEECCFLQHHGRGHDPLRQESAHIHSALPTPDGMGLFVADLGLDRLYQYRIGPGGELTPHTVQPWVQVKPGQGPRHFAFHPDGERLYLVTEMGQTLITYKYHKDSSTLEYQNEYPLYDDAPVPADTAAGIQLSPDGEFVYASVRGSDRIYCFKVREDPGCLEAAGVYSSEGRWPRSIGISPDGAFLAAANQKSGNVAVFPRDPRSGELGKPAVIAVPGAVCVKWG